MNCYNVIFVLFAAIVTNVFPVGEAAACPGCSSNLAFDDPKVLWILNSVTAATGTPENNVQIIKATKQVVNGVKYVLTYKILNPPKNCEAALLEKPDQSVRFVYNCDDERK